MIVIAIPFAILLFVLVRNNSFKNQTWIARQTGESIDDVVWVSDKFRVQNVDGVWEIRFKRIKEKTQSVDGRLWTKFIKKKYEGKVLKYPKDEWNTLDMRRHINRGIFFYETTEGELFPMTIKKPDGKFQFSLVNQDNRQFVMRETQNVNALTHSKKNELRTLLAIIIGIVVLGVVFVAGGYWQNTQNTKNMQATQEIGIEYAKAVYNITCNGGPATYVGNIKVPFNQNTPQGTPGG
jgi:hypothetical protein